MFSTVCWEYALTEKDKLSNMRLGKVIVIYSKCKKRNLSLMIIQALFK